MNKRDAYCFNGEYIGWIPTISGELIFSHSSPGLVEYDYFNINVYGRCRSSSPNNYLILSSSVVDWKDSGLLTENGRFRVVVILESMPEIIPALPPKTLCGSIYLIAKPESTIFQAKNSVSEIELFKEMQNLAKIATCFNTNITGIRDENCSWESLCNSSYLVEQKIEDIKSERVDDEESVVKIDVVINSEGFIFLGIEDGSLNITKIEHYTLCRQAFYYIKYLFHKHTHHDYTSESLTTIHAFNADKKYVSAINLISDLKQGLVDIKRNSNAKLVHATGIASYAKSLAVSCNRKGLLENIESLTGSEPSEYVREEISYFSHVIESLNILQSSHRKEYYKTLFSSSHKVIGIIFLFLSPLLFITIRQAAINARCTSCENTTNNIDSNLLSDFFYRFASWDMAIIIETYLSLIVVALIIAYLIEISPVNSVRSKFTSWLRTNATSVYEGIVPSAIWYLNTVFIFSGKFIRINATPGRHAEILEILATVITWVKSFIIGILMPIGIYLIYLGVTYFSSKY